METKSASRLSLSSNIFLVGLIGGLAGVVMLWLSWEIIMVHLRSNPFFSVWIPFIMVTVVGGTVIGGVTGVILCLSRQQCHKPAAGIALLGGALLLGGPIWIFTLLPLVAFSRDYQRFESTQIVVFFLAHSLLPLVWLAWLFYFGRRQLTLTK